MSSHIAVIGDCQSHVLAQCIKFMNHDLTIEQYSTWSVKNLDIILAENDFVFCQSPIAEKLTKDFPLSHHKIIHIPHITFSAFHPDLVYVHTKEGTPNPTGENRYVQSPIGDWNSSLTLLAWLHGIELEKTLALFNKDTFQRLGFLNQWHASELDLLREGKNAGMPLEEMLQEWIKLGCFMYGINHPKLPIVADLARAAMNKAGLALYAHFPEEYLTDILKNSVIFPVYPEVAEHLGVKGEYLFKMDSKRKSEFTFSTIPLREFVQGSFDAYAKIPREHLVCSRLHEERYRLFAEHVLMRHDKPYEICDATEFKQTDSFPIVNFAYSDQTPIDIVNIVVIRFSLKLNSDWSFKAYGDETNRENWFKFRSDIFNNTLGQCLKNQTKLPDKVYLLMDESDQSYYLKYLNSDQYHPIFSVNSDHFVQVEQDMIACGYNSNIAIYRIDSDDLISCQYIYDINARIEIAIKDGLGFDFIVNVMGYRSDLSKIQSIYYNCSPFLVLFEKMYSKRNVYGFNHENVIDLPHIQNLTPGWIQLIHSCNVSNNFSSNVLDSDSFKIRMKENPKLIGDTFQRIDDEWFLDWAGFPIPKHINLDFKKTGV